MVMVVRPDLTDAAGVTAEPASGAIVAAVATQVVMVRVPQSKTT